MAYTKDGTFEYMLKPAATAEEHEIAFEQLWNLEPTWVHRGAPPNAAHLFQTGNEVNAEPLITLNSPSNQSVRNAASQQCQMGTIATKVTSVDLCRRQTKPIILQLKEKLA